MKSRVALLCPAVLLLIASLPSVAAEKEFSWTRVTEATDNSALPNGAEAYVLRCADDAESALARRWRTRHEFAADVLTAKIDLAEQAWTCAVFAWTAAGFSDASNYVSFSLAAPTPAPTPPPTPKVPKAPVLSVK